MAIREIDVVDGTAAPTIGFWRKGSMVINSAPSATTPTLWLCTASGEPGTWTALGGGAISPTNVAASGSITSSSATAGIGYATGAGGTVTQASSKSTGVTLSKTTGQITMNAASLAANTTVSFVLTNTAIAATDLLVLNHVSGGTAGAYTLNARAGAGSATIDVRNVTAGALAEEIVIGFAVVKAVTA